jgi:hypothetical protein
MSNTTITPVININMALGDNVEPIFKMVDDANAVYEKQIEEIALQIYDERSRRTLLDLVTAVASQATRVALIAGWEYGKAGIDILDEG